MEAVLFANDEVIAALLDDAYANRIHNLKQSVKQATEALQLSRTAGTKRYTGKSLNHLSLFYMIRGDWKRSIHYAKEAIHCFNELNDEKGVADAKYSIGGVYYKTNNHHLGLIYLYESLAIYRKFNDHYNQARTYKALATIYEFFGDQKNAVRAYDSAIDAAKKVNDINILSNIYNPLSGIYLKQNKIAKATKTIERAIAIKTKTGDIRGLAFALYGRGKIHSHAGRYVDAETDFEAAVSIHLNAGEKLGLGMAYRKMGDLYCKTGQYDKARDMLLKGVELSEKYNLVIILFKCHQLLYQLAKLQNDTARSLAHLELYLQQKETVINTQTLKVIENYELIARMESMEQEARLQREKAEIIEKQQRAEQSARMKQEFLSTMSHEIRTPLNAVTTITSLLTPTSTGDSELLESLKFASNNLLLVINDILDFTKLDSGKIELENRPCPFHQLLDRIIKTYNSMAHKKGIELILKADETLADCYELDETKLSQILGNLLSNAIKFTDTGNVTLSVSLISETEACDVLRFTVSDTGTGIPEDFIPEIFESFSQPKSITTRKQGGTGLGLAIVKKLTELYGSEVKVTSVLGQGSSFIFDLALTRSITPDIILEKHADGLAGKTVLLAEDNAINAMVARKLLSNWGMISEHAANGVEAVRRAETQKFDFILMDIHMPEMNGFDATAAIRDNQNLNAKTPVFALTADITAENNNEYRLCFNGFLRKPIEIDRLYQALLQSGY